VASDNTRRRPIMLHRALFGSVERFFGVLLEHYGGSFPAWLAPVQVRVLAVTSEHDRYAESVRDALAAAGFRADWVAADEQLGKRIRSAKLERLPYVLVVGAEDVRDGTVGVNPRGGEVVRGVPVAQFVERLRAETAGTTVA
jgi:threonyl-tRNA synthetase